MARKRKSHPGPYLAHLELLTERIPDAAIFPYTLAAIRNLSLLAFHPKVTFLFGENGTGKSTLLESVAVACGLNPEGGSVNFNFATRDSHSSLDQALRLARTFSVPGDSYFLRAESFYNVASEVDRIQKESGGMLDHYGGKSLHEQSHGESFFALFDNRFGDNGLYLMDEPEAALSPKRQLEFIASMHGYLERGGQFVIATHSPIIMAYPHAWIYKLDAEGIRRVEYKDTEHYSITRGFLNHPEIWMKELLSGDGG